MKTKPLSSIELAKMYEHSSDMIEALIFLGTKTGFRISELLSLKVADVINQETISVERRHIKGKLSSRSVPITKETKDRLAAYISTLPSTQTYLFNSSIGRLSRHQAWRLIKRASTYARVSGNVATHSLRKTFATNVHAAANSDLLITQRALGHRSINSTVNYLEVYAEKVSECILKA